jgi:hypothetical protein
MSTKSQNLDQAVKGGALGVWVYFATKWNLDAEAIAVLTPAIALGLAWLSTKIGDPTVASFIAKKPVEVKPTPKKKKA